ncbi:sigma-70 family RNA polymerase sigma factor [Solibacillus merdavium]|uniref:Sigma-70 family RNA polymerase sigma factor n=1 Tax=Solibacillus merdavium TaxID=2762218 RepID=A0ABR8XKW4_9BACL|nr:sigma-70 family RNA polymerase sigma factor [Solibacillus merdavium]MBD8032546.1 sigma-70 family RNA polymerase sigma factor [Solibacillus merdavium]
MDFERLVHTYTNYLLKLSFLYVKDRQAAEDIVQDVWLKVMLSKNEITNEKSYLVQITVNQCKDYLKSWRYKKVRVIDVLGFERGTSQQDELIILEEKSAVGKAVWQLPFKYREIIILYYYDTQTVRDIAFTLKLAEGTVKTRLIKARKLLKEQLNESDWEVLNSEE